MISMPDSTVVANLPGGYPAYLGYADGDWPTAAALAAKFPAAELVILTVTGTTAAHGVKIAPGIDDEPGNPDATQAAGWVRQQLDAGAWRPIAYADLASEGYSMSEVLAGLAALGIARAQVRLLTAHYGIGEHICGPGTCGELAVDADGTQWTDDFAGLNGSLIDMSALADDFFATPAPALTYAEVPVQLPILRQGDTDKPGGGFYHVRRLQALLSLTGELNGIEAAKGLAVDGQFGPATEAAVRAVEEFYHADVDGVCGPQVWTALLTGAA